MEHRFLMQSTTLGASVLSVSRIGLGLAALGRPGYINLGHAADLDGDYGVAAMAANAHAVLDAAWAAGIRYFDAARSYGRAEEFLAGWLRARGIDPTAVTVGSKWGYAYTAESADEVSSPPAMTGMPAARPRSAAAAGDSRPITSWQGATRG